MAPISMASTPSAMSSPAPGPAAPIPSTARVSGSHRSFVTPSVRPKVSARPEAAHGKRVTFTGRFSAAACVSVRPHQASSGSVKTTAGTARAS